MRLLLKFYTLSGEKYKCPDSKKCSEIKLTWAFFLSLMETVIKEQVSDVFCDVIKRFKPHGTDLKICAIETSIVLSSVYSVEKLIF